MSAAACPPATTRTSRRSHGTARPSSAPSSATCRTRSLAVEPGRAIAAEAGVLVTSVIGVAERGGRRWVHLDVGAFNGLMESLETDRRLRYPIRAAGRGRPLVRCSVTGPTCDSEDTVLHDALLPADLEVGERLYVCSAGAYTTAYASRFNGFDIPPTLLVGRPALRAVASS